MIHGSWLQTGQSILLSPESDSRSVSGFGPLRSDFRGPGVPETFI